MNVQQFYEAIVFLREKDRENNIQSRLVSLRDQLDALANQPNNQNVQTAVMSSLEQLESALANLNQQLTPAEIAVIREVGGSRFFDTEMGRRIRQRLSENVITPAVVKSEVDSLTNERHHYLLELEKAQQSLPTLGIKKEPPDPGAVELSMLIPRSLFENHLGPLGRELQTLNRIIRVFSEIATSGVEPVEVKQISTSDPHFMLGGLSAGTLLLISRVVDWGLKKWREVEEIRKLRVETKKLGVEAAITAIDQEIDRRIRAGIEEQKQELIQTYTGNESRRNELAVELTWALESLNARIERGLVMEIRVLAPPQESADPAQSKLYADLNQASRLLQFSSVSHGEPVLTLPPPEPPRGDA